MKVMMMQSNSCLLYTSIIELGRENGHRMRDLNTTGAHMIKFTAETKCSGVDLQDGTQTVSYTHLDDVR